MKIFTDTKLTDSALLSLQGGTVPHELLFASQPASSVLAESASDPALAEAEIAFWAARCRRRAFRQAASVAAPDEFRVY